eukprot:TRINITY_DN21385_c0_g1_i1.p2 TRINITY_DN21385_c0_g1~~TRINITY_DN21385_c0_g1_i1.p2  ORF type:complete len:162 (+),score=50.60 TRINITY_DN21385_c0_g1_i1:37-486(+)
MEPEGGAGQDGLDEWHVIDQVLTYLSSFEPEPGSQEAEEVLPLLDALRRATAIVQGRPQMVAMAEQERREIAAQVQATVHEWRRKSQELEQLRSDNEVLKGEAERGRQALEEALKRQAQLKEEIERAKQPDAIARRQAERSQPAMANVS